MSNMQSLDIEASSRGRPVNPYGPSGKGKGSVSLCPGGHSATNTSRYFMLGLTLFAIYGLGKMGITFGKPDDENVSKGDAAGGWGSEHGHKVSAAGKSSSNYYSKPLPPMPKNNAWDTSASHYHENPDHAPHSASYNGDIAGLELRETDFLAVLSPLVSIPSHSRPEYEKYQTSEGAVETEDILYDKNTPHGKAFDFILNRDKRPLGHDDTRLIQRFVLTLLFYATGGRDENAPKKEGSRRSGWDSDTAHFLSGLHECHWVKKSFEDSFWGILSIDSDSDRRVGVTKCNDDMEVTEIRLADLNLVGFMPDEIKWLSSLESLDIQNNHLAGHIPHGVGELDELRYLSLDGNNFSGTIPDTFSNLAKLERAYLNFNDFNGAMASSLCALREEGVLEDLWSDCGGYPITCTCCTVCCDMVAECNEMESQKGGDGV